MANARIGSHPSHGYQVAQTIDGTLQLGMSDSGKVFYCEQVSADHYVVNLPKLSAEIAGWHCKFILSGVLSNQVRILGWGLPAAGASSPHAGDNDKICKHEYLTADAATTNRTDCDGLAFTDDAVLGDMIEFSTDGSTWFAYVLSTVAAGIAQIDDA